MNSCPASVRAAENSRTVETKEQQINHHLNTTDETMTKKIEAKEPFTDVAVTIW